jgi:hypothetical protein
MHTKDSANQAIQDRQVSYRVFVCHGRLLNDEFVPI